MREWLRLLAVPLLAASAAAVVGTGCQQVAAVQQAQALLQTVPAAVHDMLSAVTATNHVQGWGNPSSVVVDDGRYLFLYPTPAVEQKLSGPRMILIDTKDQTTRLAELQHMGR